MEAEARVHVAQALVRYCPKNMIEVYQMFGERGALYAVCSRKEDVSRLVEEARTWTGSYGL